MKPIPPSEMVECVKRELAMRRKVYPALVFQGKMTRDGMDREIAVMQEVLKRIERIENPELGGLGS